MSLVAAGVLAGGCGLIYDYAGYGSAAGSGGGATASTSAGGGGTGTTSSTSASSTGGQATCDHKPGVTDCSSCGDCANGVAGPCDSVHAACTNDVSASGCNVLLSCVEQTCNPGPAGCVGTCGAADSPSVQATFNTYETCFCAQCAMSCHAKLGCP
jgi:hypothetical protein